MNSEVLKTIETLQNGGTILYPTDTIWGLGCNALNSKAVQRIFDIKQRANHKSLILLVNSLEMLKKYVPSIPLKALELIQNHPKPLTLIYSNPQNLPAHLIHAENTIAIRIVKNEFCEQIIQKTDAPLVSTSANISGQPSPTTFDEISPEILKAVDYSVNLQRKNKAQYSGSTIIQLEENGQMKVLRK